MRKMVLGPVEVTLVMVGASEGAWIERGREGERERGEERGKERQGEGEGREGEGERGEERGKEKQGEGGGREGEGERGTGRERGRERKEKRRSINSDSITAASTQRNTPMSCLWL